MHHAAEYEPANGLTTRGKLALGAIAGALFLAIVLSVILDENAGIDSVLVILFLVVLALYVPEVREALRNATNIELPGGFKLVRGSGIADAASAVRQLPVPEDESADADGWRLLGADWADDPKEAMRTLRERFRERLAFVRQELYPELGADVDPVETVTRLEEEDLIDVTQARIAKAIFFVQTSTLKDRLASDRDAESAKRFMQAADQLVYSFRYIPMDASIRRRLKAAGFVLIDYDQRSFASKRWPDFYVADEPAIGERRAVLRMSIRSAVMSDSSDLLARTRDRLQDTRKKKPETPLDRCAHHVIVVPDSSSVTTDTSPPQDRDTVAVICQSRVVAYVQAYAAGVRSGP